MWNDLPQEVMKTPTVNCFKGHFERYNADSRYSMEWRYGPPVNAEETTTKFDNSSTYEDRSTGISAYMTED